MIEMPRGIYGITSNEFGMDHIESAKILLEAGIKIIQYREKKASTRRMYEEAKEIKDLCRKYNAIFIVNDRLDIAMAVDADGVHLGQDDMPIQIAKKFFGNKIIGISARNVREALEAQENGATYLGVGSIFPTGTKADSEVIGLDEFEKIVNVSKIPIYAIGGIKIEHVEIFKKYKIHGIAVISGILASSDPLNTAREFQRRWFE